MESHATLQLTPLRHALWQLNGLELERLDLQQPPVAHVVWRGTMIRIGQVTTQLHGLHAPRTQSSTSVAMCRHSWRSKWCTMRVAMSWVPRTALAARTGMSVINGKIALGQVERVGGGNAPDAWNSVHARSVWGWVQNR